MRYSPCSRHLRSFVCAFSKWFQQQTFTQQNCNRAESSANNGLARSNAVKSESKPNKICKLSINFSEAEASDVDLDVVSFVHFSLMPGERERSARRELCRKRKITCRWSARARLSWMKVQVPRFVYAIIQTVQYQAILNESEWDDERSKEVGRASAHVSWLSISFSVVNSRAARSRPHSMVKHSRDGAINQVLGNWIIILFAVNDGRSADQWIFFLLFFSTFFSFRSVYHRVYGARWWALMALFNNYIMQVCVWWGERDECLETWNEIEARSIGQFNNFWFLVFFLQQHIETHSLYARQYCVAFCVCTIDKNFNRKIYISILLHYISLIVYVKHQPEWETENCSICHFALSFVLCKKVLCWGN